MHSYPAHKHMETPAHTTKTKLSNIPTSADSFVVAPSNSVPDTPRHHVPELLCWCVRECTLLISPLPLTLHDINLNPCCHFVVQFNLIYFCVYMCMPPIRLCLAAPSTHPAMLHAIAIPAPAPFKPETNRVLRHAVGACLAARKNKDRSNPKRRTPPPKRQKLPPRERKPFHKEPEPLPEEPNVTPKPRPKFDCSKGPYAPIGTGLVKRHQHDVSSVTNMTCQASPT